MKVSWTILRQRIPLTRLSISQRRPYASKESNASKDSKAPSTTSAFYRQFTRPVAKVFLMAVFWYQLVYFAWAKLDTEEAKAQADATISDLEAKVEEYKKGLADAKPKSA